MLVTQHPSKLLDIARQGAEVQEQERKGNDSDEETAEHNAATTWTTYRKFEKQLVFFLLKYSEIQLYCYKIVQ
jgi:DNA replication protein DnaD